MVGLRNRRKLIKTWFDKRLVCSYNNSFCKCKMTDPNPIIHTKFVCHAFIDVGIIGQATQNIGLEYLPLSLYEKKN